MNTTLGRTCALSMASLLLFVCGCRQTGPAAEPTPAGARVENATLGLAIAELPSVFEVETNNDGELILTAEGATEPGVVRFEVGPEEQGSVNIVEAASGTKAIFESREEGEFFGNQELMTPIGSFFTARGGYREGEGRIEELLAFTLHPSSNRLVRLSFRYPAGEAAERAPQFALLLGELEGYDSSQP